MLFNDAYYFNDFFGRCRSNVERRTDHEFKYRADYFARCCYCGFGHDDSSCCFFFFIRRGQRKHVAPDDPIRGRSGALLFGRVFKHRSFVQTMSKGRSDRNACHFTLIIVLVALSESLGAENILGAFLAGFLFPSFTKQRTCSATGFIRLRVLNTDFLCDGRREAGYLDSFPRSNHFNHDSAPAVGAVNKQNHSCHVLEEVV